VLDLANQTGGEKTWLYREYGGADSYETMI